ncbi:unnamed protein product [Rotaria magnacalcarata]|uniref:Uncharacterized protein n=1 Tax=Rotaria magnacalcarata TaxID=392030 RepID=A0A816T984_9BILA|nr:unnamed protein product [Rotaria magnacalcarata]CAF4246696.1 unnamed protein product [Rotaria magnacalcarata]
MPFCASSNASNILFALPSQFGWLFRSNRLFTNDTMNISTNSWWGSTNYYLSVMLFLVATDIGLIKKSDRSAKSKNLPETVNKSLKVLMSIRFDWLSIIEKVWARLTFNYEAKVYAQNTLDKMSESKLVALKNLAKAITNTFLYRSDHLSNI